MAEKRTKSDKAQRQANHLEEQASRRPAQGEKKKTTCEDVNQAATRIVTEATEKS